VIMSVESHQRARTAIAQGLFEDEIVPVRITQRNGESLIFDTDERPMDTDMEKISQLKPASRSDGTATAGNSSGINDAAAAILLMSREKADHLGLNPIARVKAWASGGLDPAYMGFGAVAAAKKILDQEKLHMSDFGTIELNEAFAVQALACMRELDCGPENTNPLGGGISIGHPIGCTGARIIFSLAKQLKRKEQSLGLASFCIGGGQGMAVVLENV
jgi:acetyl-CoA C-acetyltransferase